MYSLTLSYVLTSIAFLCLSQCTAMCAVMVCLVYSESVTPNMVVGKLRVNSPQRYTCQRQLETVLGRHTRQSVEPYRSSSDPVMEVKQVCRRHPKLGRTEGKVRAGRDPGPSIGQLGTGSPPHFWPMVLHKWKPIKTSLPVVLEPLKEQATLTCVNTQGLHINGKYSK